MITLYYTLISTYIGSLLARIAYDKKIKIMAVFWIVFVTILLIFVSGLRDGIGDTGMYKHAYTVLVNDPKSVQTYEDVGFGLFNLFLIQFSTNPQILIFIVALITNIFNMICFSRSRSYI